MEENKKIKAPVDWIMFCGLMLWLAYTITNRFFVKVPDAVAYPWLIGSCALLFIGLFRSGVRLGEFFRNRNK